MYILTRLFLFVSCKNYSYLCVQIIQLFVEFKVFFFQNFISKLQNPRFIFLYSFIMKNYNFLKSNACKKSFFSNLLVFR